MLSKPVSFGVAVKYRMMRRAANTGFVGRIGNNYMCSSSNNCPRVVGSLCSNLIVCVYPGQRNHRGHCELSPYGRGWDAKPYLYII